MPAPNMSQILDSSTFNDVNLIGKAFTGADIVAYLGHKRVATLQGITWSVTREIMPIFVMGDPNPQAFPKGKRAIAGNLVFTQFDKHAILKYAQQLITGANGVANYIGELNSFLSPTISQTAIAGNFGLGNQISNQANFLGGSQSPGGGAIALTSTDLAAAIANELQETYALVARRVLRYADQIPPFDITLTMVNETGDAAYMAIQQVQLVNEGGGYTLDDLNSEAAFTFVARSIIPLTSLMDTSNTGGLTSKTGYSAGQY